MKNLLSIIFLMASIACFQSEAYAQTDTTKSAEPVLYKIIKHDGTEYVGEVISDDGREVLIKTQTLGNIYIPKADIKSMKVIDDKENIVDGSYRDESPFTTRYHFTTNALPIRKRDDYALINLYGPEVHFATSERFSIGVMTTWIASPFVLALKYTIPTGNEKINFGLGSLIGTSGYLNNFAGYGGLHWGMITFGDRTKNITVSAGFTHIQPGFRERNLEVPGVYPAIQNDFGGTSYPIIPSEQLKLNPITAPVVSIGAIANVGTKASFIFDGMVFFSKQKGKGRNIEHQYETNGDLKSVTVTEDDNEVTVFYLMPGMRFQQTETRAFQVALAGATYIRSNRVISFPVPTVSWFFKF